MSDPINPDHYTRFPVEVIEITEHLNFCRGNAVKYIARAGAKDPGKELEDLKKAAWYLDREIARVGAAAAKTGSFEGLMYDLEQVDLNGGTRD